MFPPFRHIKLLFWGLIVSTIVMAGLSIYQKLRWEWIDKQKTVRVLPNYTSSLNLETCEEFYKDETLYREKGGCNVLTDKAYDKITQRINEAVDDSESHDCHLDKGHDDLLRPPSAIVPGPAHRKATVKRGVNFKDDV